MLGLYLSFEEDERDLLVILDELQFYDCKIITWHDLLCLEELHLLGYLHVECCQTRKKLAHRPYITCNPFMDQERHSDFAFFQNHLSELLLSEGSLY